MWVAAWLTTTSDLRTNESSRSSRSDVVGIVDNRSDARQVEPAGEDRRLAQQLALVVVQQVVRPANRELQGLLALGPAVRSLQQPEAIAEAVPHLDRAHGGHARRGQLDPQRESVEGRADLCDRGGGLRVVQPEAGAGRAGALHEQRDRIGRDATLERQWRDRQQRLAGHPQVLARGGKYLGIAAPAEDLADGRACGLEHVLAVVDHQQQATAGDGFGDGVDQLDVSLRRDAQCSCKCSRYRRRVAHGSELDQPDTIGELVGHLGADLESESCLADTAHSAQGDQPVGAHEFGDIGKQLIATDEGAELLRQVAGERPQAAQRWELRGEPIGDDLMHGHPPTETAEAMLAERPQRQPVPQQDLGGVRDDDLPAVGGRHQPRGAVHLRAEVVAISPGRLAGVQPDPNAEGDGVRTGEQLLLDLDGSLGSVGCRRERGTEAVAAGGEHVAAVLLDRAAHDAVVDLQCHGHLRRHLFPQPRRILDVAEQERHRPSWKIRRHGGNVSSGSRAGRPRSSPHRAE